VKSPGKFAGALASSLVLVLTLGTLLAPLAEAAAVRRAPPAPFVTDEIIVKFKPGVEGTGREKALAGAGLLKVKRKCFWGNQSLEVVKLPAGADSKALIAKLKTMAGVAYAQPNYVYKPCATAPNDPLFSQQWGLNNTLFPDYDIDALTAWDLTTGSPAVVVAVLDEGVDINHPDLAANIWVHSAETGDSDGDGFSGATDRNGWDFFWNDSTVFDSGLADDHGTHVAGTIAAVMNNSIGIAGVAPNVRILPLKFMGPGGGSTMGAVQAINYAIKHQVKIINASWGSGAYDQALKDAIQAFGDSGGVFIAAAGNGDASQRGFNTDITPFYPAGYDLPNIISVAAVDRQGGFAQLSNYGRKTVDLAAPGVSITGTKPSIEPVYGPAAVEVSDPSLNYRAVVWGFGAESFTDPAARSNALARTMTSLGLVPGPSPPGSRVLLVDDDQCDTNCIDYGSYYLDPLTALGYSVTVLEVISNQVLFPPPVPDGPDGNTLAGYDAVVWFTGEAFGGGGVACLTPNDQANLTTYLNGGGKLFLSGRDAIWDIETSIFVRNTLRVWDLGQYNGPVNHAGLSGAGGAYAGVDWSGLFVGTNADNFIAPWGSLARVGLNYTGGLYTNAYGAMDGTSAAAPYVSGVAALLLSRRPTATSDDIVDAITSTTTQMAVLQQLTVTGGLVNAKRALQAIDLGVSITPVSLSLAEGGAGAGYAVALRSAPTADVTITAVPGPEVAVDNGKGGATLVFTLANWNVPQTMAVRAVDDNVVEGPHAGLITHTAQGGNYQGAAVPTVTVAIADNDSPGVSVTESGGSTSVTEGAAAGQLGYSDTYTVVLNRQPSANVTIIASPDSQVAVDNGAGGRTLVFTPSDWNLPKTFTVTAVEDSLFEGPHAGVISHGASGGGYTGCAVAPVTVSVTDNDKPAVVITESGGATVVTEGGATDTITVGLSAAPPSDLTVAITTDGQTTVNPASLVFTAADWTTKTVTVTAFDDVMSEGLHYSTISLAASGGGYAPVTPVGTVMATVIDNESPGGVSIIQTGGATTVYEGGATATYSVVLTVLPTGPVTITATPDAKVTVNNGSGGRTLTFGIGDWNMTKSFTVTAVDDTVVEGTHLGLISHTASGGGYDLVTIAPLTATIIDNDLPVVTITESGSATAVTEGAPVGSPGYSDTYTVTLGAQPCANVVITAVSDGQVTVTGPSGTNKLTFTPANWNVAQTVTVIAVDDAVVEGSPHSGVITHSAGGGGYTGWAISSVTAGVTDNEVPSVLISEAGGSTTVTEAAVAPAPGATDTYTVVLGAQPSGPVTVTVTPEATGDINWPTKVLVAAGAGPSGPSASLTFGPTNWNLPQTVTVAAVDDNLIEGPHSTVINHAVSGGGYTGCLCRSVTVGIIDNDTAGVSIGESDGSTAVTEGAAVGSPGYSDTYSVVLTQLPNGNVTITAATSGGKVTVAAGQGAAGSTATLTFTTLNWNTPQTITVLAVDDNIVEGPHTATISHTASGGGYDGVAIANVSAGITDNDIPGVTVTASSGGTNVNITEGAVAPAPGAVDTYTMVLTCQPSANVIVTAISASGVTVVGPAGNNSLTFTPKSGESGGWNVAQTFTVTAVDDVVVEGTHAATISHTATGGGYFGVSISNVTATITDNDLPSVTVTESGGSTAVTEGALPGAPGFSDTYTVVLDHQPCAEVTVTVSAASQVLVSAGGSPPGAAATLTFTTATWSTPQTVTVRAYDDETIEGPHTGAISHSASGGAYTGCAIVDVIAGVTCDDIPGVSIIQSGGSTNVTEGAVVPNPGATDAYTVVLTHVPNSEVTLTVTASFQVVVSSGGAGGPFGGAATLTFTTQDWNVPRTVTVAAVDDPVVEGPHTGTITHVTSGGGYDAPAWGGVTAYVTDNDHPGVTVVESNGVTSVTEGALLGEPGYSDTYTVVLDHEPCGDVTIAANPSQHVTVDNGRGGRTLVFTPVDWSVPQTFTVQAFDDTIVEGTPHAGVIIHGATGGGYSGCAISGVTAQITDNDVPKATITESGGATAVTEGAASGAPGYSDTYTVFLNGEPSGTVTVTASVSPTGTITVAAPGRTPGASTTLTFTTANWATPQTITVRAIDDTVVEGTHPATITHTPSGGGYDLGSIPEVIVSVTDNDLPAVTVTESAGSTRVTEGAAPGTPGATDTYTVVLGRRPCGSVTISLTTSPDGCLALATGGGAPGPAATLNFTTLNWNVAQTVTVSANDDAIVEGTHPGTITHTATGGAYDGVVIRSVPVTVTDNDLPAVTITEAGGSTAVAEGAAPGQPGSTDTYSVVLVRQPSGPVTITAAAGPTDRITLNAGTGPGQTAGLTFTPADWNVPQFITVVAVDDALVEGNHTAAIGHSASGGSYTGVAIAPVSVTITDNDPGLVIGGEPLSVQVGSYGDNYTVCLSTPPTADVTVTVTPDQRVTVSSGGGSSGPFTLVFTAANWSVPRSVTVEAAGDQNTEAGTATITHAAVSADPAYAALPVRSVNVTVENSASGGYRTIDPRYDTVLRFGRGVTVFVPAGVVGPPAPGDSLSMAVAGVAAPPDPEASSGQFTSPGVYFDLSMVLEQPLGSREVHDLVRPITIVVELDAALLSGVDPARVGLYVYDPDVPDWVFVPGRYDPENGLLVASLWHLSEYGVLSSVRTFGDIATHWARRDIETLAGRKVIQGVSPWSFAPQELVTRAQFCALLVRALGLPKEGSGVTPFADVPSEAWFAREVHTAYDAGLVQGLGPTTFGPERRITRQELAVLLARALEQAELAQGLGATEIAYLLRGFTDVKLVAQWAREGVAQAVGEGLVKGRTATTIAPLGTATRAEAATMLKRLMDQTMKLPVTFTGLLHVSSQGGRHFEFTYAGGPGDLDLTYAPGNGAVAAELEGLVGQTVTVVGYFDPDGKATDPDSLPFALQIVTD
jgi:subtilisin family serine protease